MAYYAAVNGIFGTLPFILIFQFGFLYAAFLSLFQGIGKSDWCGSRKRRRNPTAAPPLRGAGLLIPVARRGLYS